MTYDSVQLYCIGVQLYCISVWWWGEFCYRSAIYMPSLVYIPTLASHMHTLALVRYVPLATPSHMSCSRSMGGGGARKRGEDVEERGGIGD